MVSLHDGDLFVYRAAHFERFRLFGRIHPVAPEQILQPAVAAPELLSEQVLRVAPAVGHTPRNVFVVTEVEGPRHTRHRVADHGELGAGEVHLVVHIRCVEGAMGIARYEGQSGLCAFA